MKKNKTAMAIVAHPDDIEFLMSGTLMLLKKVGYEIHYMTLSDGNCGSLIESAEIISKIRTAEAKKAASIIGASYHAPICHDFEIVYNVETLRQLAGIIREVRPQILLTHSPSDYMEDHMTTSRLAVTAAFVRCIPNFETPTGKASNFDCTIYHALPHGLIDPLRKVITPGIFINTESVQELKRKALAAHESQQSWLDASQKMSSYILEMEAFAQKVGHMSGKLNYAEGWRRHSHYGFCNENDDPLADLGEYYFKNEKYEKQLNC